MKAVIIEVYTCSHTLMVPSLLLFPTYPESHVWSLSIQSAPQIASVCHRHKNRGNIRYLKCGIYYIELVACDTWAEEVENSEVAPTSVNTGGCPLWLEGTRCCFGIVPKPEPTVLCCTTLNVSWPNWINEWTAYEKSIGKDALAFQEE